MKLLLSIVSLSLASQATAFTPTPMSSASIASAPPDSRSPPDILSTAMDTFAEHRDKAVSQDQASFDTEIPAVRPQPQQLSFAKGMNRPQASYFEQQQQQPEQSAEQYQERMSLPEQAISDLSAFAGRLQGKTFGSPRPEQWID